MLSSIIQAHGYQIKEKLLIWGLLLFIAIIAIAIRVERRGMRLISCFKGVVGYVVNMLGWFG